MKYTVNIRASVEIEADTKNEAVDRAFARVMFGENMDGVQSVIVSNVEDNNDKA